MQIGEKIKYFRKRKGLTIKELSTLTNLSIGFISNLERDLNSPSVSNLQQLCNVLDIDLIELIQPSEPKKCIIRKNERKEIFTTSNDKIKYELLTSGFEELNCICITLQGGSNYGETSWGHNHDEIGIIVKGSLHIEIDGEISILNEGDLVYINKFTPHKYSNPSDETCISYWFEARK